MSLPPPLSPNGLLRYDVVRAQLQKIATPDGRLGDVLEIGCGQGAVGARLARLGRYTGLDLDETSTTVATRRVANVDPGSRVLNGPIDDVLEPGERFDVVCAFEVLEHIHDDASALASWRMRLRPGGSLVLSVPAYSDRYAEADRMVGHFRRYDRLELAGLLQRTGFREIQLTGYGAPLGFVLEKGRNAVAARRGHAPYPPATDGKDITTAERQSRSSGRTLQPPDWMGPVLAAGLWPFQRVQRLFPDRGPGLVATAVRGD